MGKVVEYFLQQREIATLSIDDDERTKYAELLGGEIDGSFIRCPSPGRPANDRSCHVRIDGPNRFFIYACEGPEGAAYAIVGRKLKLERLVRYNDSSAIIKHIMSESVPAKGTLAETYLRTRALTLSIPECLHFHPSLKHTPSKSSFWPGLVAARTDSDDRIVAIHRTFIARDGRGKAPVKPVRMDLGMTKGTAIRLSPLTDELMIGEGIETTLSVIQETGKAGWAAGSTSAMKTMDLPMQVKSVIILADGDDAGEAAARFAAYRWRDSGRHVRVIRPPRGKDFNEVLMKYAPRIAK
jgi:hypothetical protein